MSLSQIELVRVRVRVEWECFWVNLREDNKVSESKMAVSEPNMVKVKMAAIIKLSQNEWVKCFVKMVGTNLGKCESVWKKILRWQNTRWPNSRQQNSRWLPSSSWVRMNESSFFFFVQIGWNHDGRIQDGRFPDGCHLQVNQIELVWVRVRLEWECFEWIWEKITRCLNPRWPN